MENDKLDIKIKEAANHTDPTYNEEAWDQMQKLLDEHLPQQKKDYRKIFWIFFAVIIAAGGFLSLIYFSNNPASQEKIKTEELSQRQKEKEVGTAINLNQEKTKTASGKSSGKVSTDENRVTNDLMLPEPKKVIEEKAPTANKENSNIFSEKADKNINNNVAISFENKTAEIFDKAFIPLNNYHQELKIRDENVNLIEPKPIFLLQKTNENQVAPIAKKEANNKNKFNRSFSLAFSAGPDVSAANIDKIGKIKMSFGIGIGYQFAEKWKIRTGLYLDKKVYNASPADYHPPGRFWNNYPDLKTIEAACKIYSIPLLINYNLSENSRNLWFISGGLSSYFMKKEEYEYYSKNPSGQPSYSRYEIDNKNKHYFSVARLSAGFEKKINNNISFTTEPYFNVPLAGVGFGKVKLYSSGVLFTLNVKPFTKK